jgi:hypothetical protein
VEIDLKQVALENEVLDGEKRKMPQPDPHPSSSQRLRVGGRKLPGPPPQQAQGQLCYPPQGIIPPYTLSLFLSHVSRSLPSTLRARKRKRR